MNAEQAQAVMQPARECAVVMLHNACYIESELRNVHLPHVLRLQASTLCSDLNRTAQDVLSELSELDGFIAAGAAAPMARAVDRIERWLKEELLTMDAFITKLRTATNSGPTADAYVLIAESATNILMAFEGVSGALRPRPGGDSFD